MPNEYDDFVDADDNPDILQDSASRRIPMYAMDAIQREIGLALHDGQGQPVGHKPGYVFVANDHLADEMQRHYEEYNIQVGAAYKGGLKRGETVTAGHRRLTILGRDSDGKYLVRDTETLDAETIKQMAYDSCERELTNAWRRRCTPSFRNVSCKALTSLPRLRARLCDPVHRPNASGRVALNCCINATNLEARRTSHDNQNNADERRGGGSNCGMGAAD